MEIVSWNPIRMIRRYRERRERLREEERIVRHQLRMLQLEEERRTVWNPMEIIRRCRERHRIREEEERTVRINKPRLRIRGVLVRMKHEPRWVYIAFLGIPYAAPPVEDLRFQPPEELLQLPPSLRTPLLRTRDRSFPCAQTDGDEDTRRGSEDCLYLNVFTPTRPKDITGLFPVLVYIHGGGFQGGDSFSLVPDDLMREDLILVTVNYRLSIFGFLNMRAENCRGNAGLKDQVMALEWVRDNIKKFKGNPEKVTICGQSAGATCVNLHMISPMSHGLFHQAIIMAGGIYSPWGFGGHEKHVKQLFKNAVGQENELRHFVVDTLKEMETFELLKLGKGVMMKFLASEPRRMTTLFKPSVEYKDEGAFLPYSVEKLMAEAKPVPTIAGIAKQEGYQYFRIYTLSVEELMRKQVKFVDLLKEIIQQNFRWKDPNAIERHFEYFKTTYFPGDEMLDEDESAGREEDDAPMTEEEKLRKEGQERLKEEERKQRLATLITDIGFWRFYDNFKIGNLLNRGEPHFYVYEFDYFAGQPIRPMPTMKDDHYDYHRPYIVPTAAEHGDDLVFLLHPDYLDTLLEKTADRDYRRVEFDIECVKSNMLSLWSSFCQTGAPETRLEWERNVQWLPHTEDDPHYLHIGDRLSLRDSRLNEEHWSELNRICQSESTISSLPESPKTPNKESVEFPPPLQPEPGPSRTQAPDPECETIQLSELKPDDHSTSRTWADEVLDFMETSIRASSFE